jgi:hypothetical protein
MLQLRFLPVTWPTARHFWQIASILLQEKLARENVIVCFGFRRRAIRAELPSELPSHEVHCSGLTKFQGAVERREYPPPSAVHCFMGDEFYFSTFGAGDPWAGVIKGNDRSSLPSLKRTTLPAAILASVPVRGLRPIPVLRRRALKIPKAPELDAIAMRQSQLHAFEHRIHRHL